MESDAEEEKLLRSVTLQNAKAVLLARERAERELLRANARITSILESITDGFIVFDAEWRVVFLNQRGEKILRPLQKSRESLMGVSHWEAFPDTVGTPIEEHYRRAMREQVTVQLEIFYPPLGAWIDIRAYPSPEGLSVYFQDVTERKRAAEELRRQQEWFAVTLSSIGDAVIATDTRGQVIFLNGIAEAMTGWKSQEAIGQPLETVFRIINEESRQPVENPVSLVLREGKIVGLANHTVLLPKDGNEIAIEDSAAPIRDEAGTISGVVMVFHDVTERRRSDHALRESEKRFAALVTATAQVVWLADGTGGFSEYSESWHAFTGQSLEEMKGWGRLEVIHPEDHDMVRTGWQQAIDSKATLHLDYRLRNSAGEWRWAAVRAVPLLAADGSILNWVGMHTDITERKRIEEALREREERLRATFNQAAVGMAIAALDGKFLEVNQKFTEILGYTAAELRERTFVHLTHPEDLAMTLEQVAKLRAGEISEIVYEKRYLRKDGSVVWSFSTVTLLKDASGQAQRYIGVIEDITLRKRTELERVRLTNVLERSLNEIYIFDTGHLRFQYVNEGALRNLGYSMDEMRLKTPLDLKPEFTEADFLEMVQPLLTGEKPKHVFYTVHRRADGTDYPVEVHLQAVTHDGQQVFLAVILDITERQKTRQELSDSERRYRSLVSIIADVPWRSDAEGRFVEPQAAWERYTGQQWEAHQGYGWTQALHPEDRERIQSDWERQLKARKLYHTQGRLWHSASGEWRHFEVRATPLFDAAGELQEWVGACTDVHEQRKAEDELRRSEEELRALANSIPQLAWMAHADGNIFWYNHRWYEFTGTTLEQMQGLGWHVVQDPQMLKEVVARWSDSLATGQPFNMEFPLRGADGVFRWFLALAIPIRDAHGRILRWFGTNTDVDEVRRVREALRDETRVLELLNNTGKAIAANLDLQTLVQTVTDSATKLTGAKFGAFFYNVTGPQGESMLLYTLSGAPREAFEKFGLPRNTPVFSPTLQGAGVVRSGDITQDPRYGKMSPHHGMPEGHLPVRSYLAVPVISRNGEVLGGLFFGHPDANAFTERSERLVVGVAAQASIAIDNARLYEGAQKEIAERKNVEGALREAQERLSRHAEDLEFQVEERTASLRDTIGELEAFSYSISHDMRAPLRAMQGFGHILAEEYSSRLDAPAQEYIRRIITAAERMDHLIQDVLTYSRVARSEMPLTPIDLGSLLRDILVSYPLLQRPAVEIDLEGEFPVVLGIEAVLTQCVSNLLGNAAKFVAPGVTPRIRVWAERMPDRTRARIYFQDNGIGIAREAQDKIFGIFHRLSRSYDGTGIGLAIVKKGAERMEGSVALRSEPGQGSTFWLELKVLPDRT